MALKANNLIVNKIWQISGLDLTTGRALFNLTALKNATWENTLDVTKTTGGGRVVGVFSSNRASMITADSALFDVNLLALQAGDEKIYHSNEIVPIVEAISIDNVELTPTATLTKTPAANEVFTVLLNDGTALIKGETVSADTFTVSAKVITFDKAHKGKTGKAYFYCTAKEAIKIGINTNSTIQYCEIWAEVTVQDFCDSKNYMGMIVMPKAAVDPNFAMTVADSGGESAVHSIKFDASAACGATDLAYLIVYDSSDLT